MDGTFIPILILAQYLGNLYVIHRLLPVNDRSQQMRAPDVLGYWAPFIIRLYSSAPW
jgi:hypothetical protein